MTPSPTSPYHPRFSRERTSGPDDFVLIPPGRDHVGVALSDHSVMVQICKGCMRIVMAHLEHRSSGPLNLLHEAQPVEIKVETFQVTLYDTIPGNVLSVSDDAVPLEKEGCLVYAGRISMGRAIMQVEAKRIHLSPGMTVTVEIKTGQRRVIEYLLSPPLKSVHESLRKR